MIKVLLLIPTLDRSGAEKQLTLLACRLPRDEFDVHVVALTRGGPYSAQLKEAGIPLTILGKRWKFDPIAGWRLKQVTSKFQPDILHTWLFAANAYGRLMTGQNTHAKVIVSERCVDTWKSGWQHWLDRRLISRTNRLVANSNSVANFYRQQGFPSDRIVTITNGIEIPPVENVDRKTVLEEFGIPADAKVVTYIGRLAKQKRLKDLIWAMELIRRMNDKVYFLIVGDGPEQEQLVQFARDIDGDEDIRFVGHRENITRILQSVDLFWLASDFEGQSNSIMEAMAAGIPVVASDIPPNRELVVDGETGSLVKVGDRAAFAQAAQRLLNDTDFAQQMGKAGQERMRNHFSIPKMVDAHVTLYQKILSE